MRLHQPVHACLPKKSPQRGHNVGRFAPPRCGHVVDRTSDMPSYVVATLCVARCGNVRCIRCGMRLEGHAREISALRADFWRFRCPVAAATHVATLHVAAQLSHRILSCTTFAHSLPFPFTLVNLFPPLAPLLTHPPSTTSPVPNRLLGNSAL